MVIFSVDEAVARRYFIRKVSLIIPKNSQENPFAGVFFIKVASLTLLKKTPAQVVFCKFYNIFNSTSFVKQVRAAPSEHS